MLTVRTYSRSRPTTNEPSRLLRSSALCIHALARKARTGDRGKSCGRSLEGNFMDCMTTSSRTHTRHRPTPNTPTPHTGTQRHRHKPQHRTRRRRRRARAHAHAHTHKTADHAPGRCHGPSPPPILRAHATQHGTNPPTPCNEHVDHSRAQAARAPLLPRAAAQSLPLWARGDAAAAAHRHPGRSGASGSRPALASAIDLAMRVT